MTSTRNKISTNLATPNSDLSVRLIICRSHRLLPSLTGPPAICPSPGPPSSSGQHCQLAPSMLVKADSSLANRSLAGRRRLSLAIGRQPAARSVARAVHRRSISSYRRSGLYWRGTELELAKRDARQGSNLHVQCTRQMQPWSAHLLSIRW